MINVLKQVLQEKVEELESLEVRIRPYARADQLEKERMNQICSLLRDLVQGVLVALDGVESGPPSQKGTQGQQELIPTGVGGSTGT